MDDLGVPLFLETPTWIHEWLIFIYTLVNDHIAGLEYPHFYIRKYIDETLRGPHFPGIS